MENPSDQSVRYRRAEHTPSQQEAGRAVCMHIIVRNLASLSIFEQRLQSLPQLVLVDFRVSHDLGAFRADCLRTIREYGLR